MKNNSPEDKGRGSHRAQSGEHIVPPTIIIK